MRSGDKGLPSWAHPVISDGRLYVRNQDTVLVYDIKDRTSLTLSAVR